MILAVPIVKEGVIEEGEVDHREVFGVLLLSNERTGGSISITNDDVYIARLLGEEVSKAITLLMPPNYLANGGGEQ